MDTDYDSLWVRIVNDATTKLAGFIVSSIGAMFRTMGRLLASRIPGPGRLIISFHFSLFWLYSEMLTWDACNPS
jgi:hypothetical protein